MAPRKKLVMVTNDDSVQSNGLIELARAVSKFAEAVIVAPEQPQSATALSMTFHKPLRVGKVSKAGFEANTVSGTPGDCVLIGINKILPRKPDLVVSGINIGENETFQDILASGTVAAALAAALNGVPAIAFSLQVPDDSVFTLEYDQPDFAAAAEVAGEIARDVLERGMPPGAELLNVNFPSKVSRETQLVVTEVARRKYTDKVLVRKDPRGRAYYWLFGERLPSFPPESDAEAVIVNGKISVTPLALNISGPLTDGLSQMTERVHSKLSKKDRRSSTDK